jgi:hypothetical protein
VVQPSGLSQEAQRLLGTWRLVSCVSIDAEGGATFPYGDNPVGALLYTPQGYMSATLMAHDVPRMAGDDLLAGGQHHFVAYCGRFEANATHVRHFLEACSFPNWVGTIQERAYAIEGERLILTTPPITRGGVRGVGTVVWQRLPTP